MFYEVKITTTLSYYVVVHCLEVCLLTLKKTLFNMKSCAKYREHLIIIIIKKKLQFQLIATIQLILFLNEKNKINILPR